MKFNRKQYMQKECTHQEYYEQFATLGVISLVRSVIGEDLIKKSEHESFGDIPLQKWDSLHVSIGYMVGRKLGESNASMYSDKYAHARSWSLSDTVCVAKAAARIIKDSE